MRMVMAIVAAAFLAACQTTGSDGLTGGRPNILVMGEDAEPDTLPRGGSVFKRVRDALANALNDEGFNVYDETRDESGERMPKSSISPAPCSDRPSMSR